jgi:UPF0716 protein FxsA
MTWLRSAGRYACNVLFLLVLIIWPIAELIAAIAVAQWIGIGPMLAALALGVPVGWLIMRSHGRGTLRRVSAAIAQQRAPTREALDGGLAVFGGFLVMVPGFLSDLFGLLFVLRPTRALARRLLAPRLRGSIVVRAAGFTAARSGYDVDSTARDVPPPELTT